MLSKVLADLTPRPLRVKPGIHHICICGPGPLEEHQRKIRGFRPIPVHGPRQTGAGDDRTDPGIQRVGQHGALRGLHGAGGVELHGVAPLHKFALKNLVHGGIPDIFNARQQDSDGPVLALTQALSFGVHLVAQLFRCLPDQLDFLHADISASIDDIGHRAMGDAGFPGNILDGRHMYPSAPVFILLYYGGNHLTRKNSCIFSC